MSISKLTPLLITGTLLLGLFAILQLPREEEPQIIVPMMDIFLELPGASSKEVEERLSIPLEKHLAKIPGVEHVYSTSMPGRSMATVVFYVGEDAEAAMVRLYTELYAHLDLLPPGAPPLIVKPREIDDVSILAFTLWSETVDHYLLRRIAAELAAAIQDIPDVAEITLIGGPQRQMRLLLARERMAAV